MAKVRQFSCAYPTGSFGLNHNVFEDTAINKRTHYWGLNALQKISKTQNFRVQSGFIHLIYENIPKTTDY